MSVDSESPESKRRRVEVKELQKKIDDAQVELKASQAKLEDAQQELKAAQQLWEAAVVDGNTALAELRKMAVEDAKMAVEDARTAVATATKLLDYWLNPPRTAEEVPVHINSYDDLLDGLARFRVEGKFEHVMQAEKKDGTSLTCSLTCQSGWLTHAQEDGRNTLHVRDVYEPLLLEILKHRAKHPMKGAVIVGNPGIGKSWFLDYVLWALLQKGTDVLMELAQTGQFWLFSCRRQAAYEFKEVQIPNLILALQKSNEFIRLFDTAKNQKGPLTFSAYTIIASSPKRSNYQQYKENPGADVLYLGNWNQEELSEAGFQPTSDFSEERFDRYGGRPRFVALEQDADDFQRLKSELQKAFLLGFDAFAQLLTFNAAGQDNSHFFIQIVPSPKDLRLYSIAFASPYVERQWPLEVRRRDEKNFAKNLKQFLGEAVFRTGCGGIVYENYVHAKMVAEQTWKKEVTLEPLSRTKVGASMQRILCDRILSEEPVPKMSAPAFLNTSYFYVPVIRQFPVIDSFHVDNDDNVIGYQVTIATEHKPIAAAFYKLLMEFGYGPGGSRENKKFFLVFVLEEGNFGKFGFQELDWIGNKSSFQQSSGEGKQMKKWFEQTVQQYRMVFPVV